MIQISAATSPGSSGSPVIDRFGRVLGILTMKEVAPGSEGLSFAMPYSQVCTAFALCPPGPVVP